MILNKTEIAKRRNKFLSQLTLSDSSKRRYKDALDSPFLIEIIRNEFNAESIYMLEDLKMLWRLYSMINLHPINVKMHRYYSAPIMKYIRYLNGGERYGKRIDYMKKRR